MQSVNAETGTACSRQTRPRPAISRLDGARGRANANALREGPPRDAKPINPPQWECVLSPYISGLPIWAVIAKASLKLRGSPPLNESEHVPPASLLDRASCSCLRHCPSNPATTPLSFLYTLCDQPLHHSLNVFVRSPSHSGHREYASSYYLRRERCVPLCATCRPGQ